ncbi:MAG: MBL fold metallo-hydrolase [Chloroflexi bacterium]|nr:MBL fold metallo-hydrolase [Chloroflexota bacterium]
MKIRQITPNVFVDTESSEPPYGHGSNPSFVVTSAGIVMVDAAMLPTRAMKWKSEIAGRGEVRYIINTEQHLDHVAGNYFFPGTVVSHQGVRAALRGPLEHIRAFEPALLGQARSLSLREYVLWQYSQWDPEGLALAKDYQPRLPELTFSDRLTLYLGDTVFELFHLPGHTPSQVGVYVPRERVVFTGDNFGNAIQPSLAQCCPLEWVRSLKFIEGLDVDHVVPGHGLVGNKADVREFAAFIQGVIDTVTGLIRQGRSKEEAMNAVSFESRLLARHPGNEQQRMNVARLYDVLSKKACADGAPGTMKTSF